MVVAVPAAVVVLVPVRAPAFSASVDIWMQAWVMRSMPGAEESPSEVEVFDLEPEPMDTTTPAISPSGRMTSIPKAAILRALNRFLAGPEAPRAGSPPWPFREGGFFRGGMLGEIRPGRPGCGIGRFGLDGTQNGVRG